MPLLKNAVRLAVAVVVSLVFCGQAGAAPWWQAPHDYSYYRDKGDWAGKFLVGMGPFSKTYEAPADDPVVKAWAYIGGVGAYTLKVNNQLVGADSDNGSIEDYEFGKLLKPGANTITISATGYRQQIGLDGEIVLKSGKTIPLLTDTTWSGVKQVLDFPTEDPNCITECFQARPVDYTPREASAKHISLNLARISRMRDQTLLDLWRSRHVADLVKLDKDPVQAGYEEVLTLLKKADEQAKPAIAARSADKYAETEEALRPMDATITQAETLAATLRKANEAKNPKTPAGTPAMFNRSLANRIGWVLGHTVLDSDVMGWEFKVGPAMDMPATSWHGHPAGASVVTEFRWEQDQKVQRQLYIASALNPAVMVVSQFPSVRLSGWNTPRVRLPEAQAHEGEAQQKALREVPFASPTRIAYVQGGKVVSKALSAGSVVEGKLDQSWLLLWNDAKPQQEARPVLVILTQAPKAITAVGEGAEWKLDIQFADGVQPMVFLHRIFPAGTVPAQPSEAQIASCRQWAALVREYPVSYTETFVADPAKRTKTFALSYGYLSTTDDWKTPGLKLAPLPVLASYGLGVKFPNLATAEKLAAVGVSTEWGDYTGVQGADKITYTVPDPKWKSEDIYRGVCQLFPGSHKYDQSDESFQKMASWGFNHTRPQIKWADWDIQLVNKWDSNPLSLNEANFKRLDALVERNGKAKLATMINMFDDGYRIREWRNPQVYANAVELWRVIAQRYAKLPARAVLYDLVNEPRDIPMPQWNKFIKDTVSAIRTVDKTHTIVIEAGDGHANPWDYPAMIGVEDDNVIYSFHHYEWAHTWKRVTEQPNTKNQLHYPRYLGITPDVKPDLNGNVSYNSLVDYYDLDKQEEHFLPMLRFVLKYNTALHCGEMGILPDVPVGDGERWCQEIAELYAKHGVHWSYYDYMDQGIWRFGMHNGTRVSRVVEWVQEYLLPGGKSASSQPAR